MIKFSIVFISFISYSVIAQNNDENMCKKRIDAYVKGLETSILENANIQAANAELREIARLRENLKDCDVITKIPAFVETENALKFADEALKK